MSPHGWTGELLDLLLPVGCVSCGTWVRGGDELVCLRCRTRLRRPSWPRCRRCHHPRGTGRPDEPDCLQCRAWPSALGAARYAFVLAPPTDDLVHALKYEGWPELAGFMASEIARLALSEARAGDCVIVPVPTTAHRLSQRGYNQAELLASELAGVTSLPLVHALERIGGARSQTSLTPAERVENVRGVFRPTSDRASDIVGARVLLVDDVLTTGATVGSAAVSLVGAGAASVTALAFARALPSRRRRAA